ncbi:Nucleotidylyl transferase [Artomyces pyxidatus]|uniref:Nucleotidylyl transferase n=1 Tax=Artomyces pyxidatus TaxID=48021 RepID=A0ACB8T2E9_9AGAM|nr:Nucleotidylyl transferase [Artomyces pyxidatus]
MPLPDACVARAILLATIDNLSTPYFLAPVIAAAARSTRTRLVIVLFSRLFNSGGRELSPVDSRRRDSVESTGSNASGPRVSHTASWDDLQRLLTYVYVQATKVAQDMDKILLDIDVLLKGYDEDLTPDVGDSMDIVLRIEGDSIPVPLPQSIADVRTYWYMPGEHSADSSVTSSLSPSPAPGDEDEDAEPSTYPVVAMGGTFDHLHAGHKILLSMAAWITEEKIIVGVTDDALLANKANRAVMEDLQERLRRVREFLQLFKPGLEYEIVPINDVYGPTGWDPNIQALVVSKETLSGGAAVDKRRKELDLPPLKTFVIDVISHTSHRLDHDDVELLKKTKMSSTFIREWIVKKRLGDGTEV